MHKILREYLHMRKIAAKWVSHALTEQQKWCRYETCRIHLERYQNEGANLLNNIITIHETWVISYYEPERKHHSADWRYEGSPRRQNFRQSPFTVKLMAILVYDVQGVILRHLVPHGETVNVQYCAAYLQNQLRSRRAVRRKRPQLKNVIILHDNAIPHKAICVCCDAGGGKYWSISHIHRTVRLDDIAIAIAVRRLIMTRARISMPYQI